MRKAGENHGDWCLGKPGGVCHSVDSDKNVNLEMAGVASALLAAEFHGLKCGF